MDRSHEGNAGERLRADYPGYLLTSDARIIEPATAAIALSVGSLSFGAGSMSYSEDANRNSIARVRGYPSPFTRTGFGVDGMIKPELVDFGGDLVASGSRIIANEPGASIITLAKGAARPLFRAYCGTSFAAPRVANIAAQLFTQFPNATSNLIRALIANSATLPSEMPSVLQLEKSKDIKEQQIPIYGYGQPDLFRAQYSAENYVVLLEDNVQIPVGSFQVFEVPPLPAEYLTTEGRRSLSVTLAFDPPTRPTRGDSYLGVTMEFNLFKDVDKDSIVRAFVKASKENQTEALTELSLSELKQQHKGKGIAVKLFPGSRLRNKGCLQQGKIEITSQSRGFDQKPLYVVVTCNRKWAEPETISMQRYALVVSISHSNPEVNLYNPIALRLPLEQRIRVR